MVSASFDDLVVSGAAKVNARFYALSSASLGDVTTSHRVRVAGQLIAALQGTLSEASINCPATLTLCDVVTSPKEADDKA